MTLDIQFQADGGYWTYVSDKEANLTTAEADNGGGDNGGGWMMLLHWKVLGASLLRQVLWVLVRLKETSLGGHLTSRSYSKSLLPR